MHCKLPKSCLHAGRCVVNFDHYCLLINTAVGDKNHPRFLAYCVVEWFLIMWGWLLAWHALQPCYNLFNFETAVRTASAQDQDNHCPAQHTSLHLPGIHAGVMHSPRSQCHHCWCNAKRCCYLAFAHCILQCAGPKGNVRLSGHTCHPTFCRRNAGTTPCSEHLF